ncbi:IS110 family transposase [Lancefieldella rimae]
MEATAHYWMALYTHLIQHGYKVCVLDPMQVRAVRKFKGQDRVKNDRLDAALIAETLRIGQFSETELASEDVISLRSLTRYSQGLKEEIAELKTKCICLLDSYFPEYSSIWSGVFSSGSMAVLQKVLYLFKS